MRLIVPLVVVAALALIVALGADAAKAVFGIAIPYAALVIFIAGFAWRMLHWAKSPVPFRIPTTCGQQKSLDWIEPDTLDNPHTMTGVIGRMALEVLFFRSLFRNTRLRRGEKGEIGYAASKWLWLAALAFHWSFLIVLIRHTRLFVDPVPGFANLIASLDGFLQIGAPAVMITSVFMLAAATFLLLRRLVIPQLRYISLAADYFPLFLLIGIASTGILMRHFVKTDVTAVKELAVSLASFSPSIPTGDIHYLAYMHLLFVCVLFAYFPFSKLMHAGGVFLSPTRNMANNSRMVHHENPWNPKVKTHPYDEYEDEFRDKMIACGLPVDKTADKKKKAKKKAEKEG